tara:strand:+ start:33187 stop:34485 length:1299 start_codon:yes stop_codon:yes gene_type:complete
LGVVEKLKSCEAVVGIIGLGYVGLPLMLQYSKHNYKVIGFDIDKEKSDKLNSGESYIEHISSDEIGNAVKAGFLATTDFSKIKEVDAIIIAVPTPINEYKEPNLSYIESTLEAILPHLREGQVVSLESTTYPGTTNEVLRPRIEEKGFRLGENFFLIFSPEREDPGNPHFTTRTIPKVVGGETSRCLEVGIALYEGIIDKVVPVSSTKAAEMTKVLENTHRAINIGLVNELKIVADKMGIDIYEVIDAASTKPFGFTAYYPGPGIGGHCIPVDPFYLTWKAREFGLHTRFIEIAGEINDYMPEYVVNKTLLALNEREKPAKGSNILVLGIAYKKNVDDVRESPSINIMEKLISLGANVSYSDPHVESFPSMRKHHLDLESVPLSKESLRRFDAVILTTAHDRFDYSLIEKESNLIIDTRGKFDKRLKNIVRA